MGIVVFPPQISLLNMIVLKIMQTDGLNKSIYHPLTSSELTVGLSLTSLLKISSSMEQTNGVFTSGMRLLHSIDFIYISTYVTH